MPFINTQMAGMDFAFPDVCLTPTPAGPVLIPYPNFAMASTAIPTQYKVFILAMPAHNLATTIPMSNGDNAGVSLNPVSGMFMGPSRKLMGSVKVLMGGCPPSRCSTPQDKTAYRRERSAPPWSPARSRSWHWPEKKTRTRKGNDMPDNPEEEKIKVNVASDLDYVYRDMINIFVGAGDVVLEFGNRHRSMPDHGTIFNRIVLSIPNAYDLQERLRQTLNEAQLRLQQSLKKQG